MATIVLRADRINQMYELVDNVKKTVEDFNSALFTLEKKALAINQGVCSVDDVTSSIQSSAQIQARKLYSLETFGRNSEKYVSDVIAIDNNVADSVRQQKEDFYKQYTYLNPERKENEWEGVIDNLETISEWCKEHWKLVMLGILGALQSLSAGNGSIVILSGVLAGAITGGSIGQSILKAKEENDEISQNISETGEGTIYNPDEPYEEAVLSEEESNGDKEGIMLLPNPGDTITISRGIDLPDETAVVSSWNTWSREYSVEGCNRKFAGSLCCRRLNYAIENYKCNSTEDDLLKFELDGYEGAVFAGAMVEGYADIGDIVQVTLDDGNSFYFLILDVKSTQHTSKELSPNKQCQCEWGHGYLLGENKVQLSVCEFITAGSCSVDNVQNTTSGKFLKNRSVVKTEIVGSIQIDDE